MLYGAAQFSRDTDILVLADPENLDRLGEAMDELQAACIAVPPFQADYLHRGHAIHFRSLHPDSHRMRIDVMSKLRGVDAFAELWERRTTLEDPDGERLDVMALPDLVQAKKTQRDKDWPMIRLLIEADYLQRKESPGGDVIRFWLQESRTPAMLAELAVRHPGLAREAAKTRALLEAAFENDLVKIERGLEAEEKLERALDREYWAPLKKELERLMHVR